MQLYECVEEDGFSIILKLLHERLSYKPCRESIPLGTKVETVILAYTDFYAAPVCDNHVYGESVYQEEAEDVSFKKQRLLLFILK